MDFFQNMFPLTPEAYLISGFNCIFIKNVAFQLVM